MVKNSTLLALMSILVCSSALAQPTITSNFSPTLGANVVLAVGDTNNISEGAAGANKTWDFSAMQKVGNNTGYTHIAPSATPYSSQFPAATLAYATTSGQGNTGYVYYKISSTAFENVGVATSAIQMYYTNPQVILQYPTTYNSSYTDTYSGSGTNSQNITTYRNGNITITADAWGTLILPQATFNNVLRVKIEQTSVDSIHFMGQDIITENRIVTYNYYRDDIKQQLMGISYTYGKDFFGDDIIIKSVFYYPDAPNAVTSLAKQDIKVYPNPATENIVIENLGNTEATSFTITDVLGKTYLAETVNYNTQNSKIDVSSLAEGIYFLSLFKNETFIGTEKLIIK
jgi:hypothetical protein